MTNDGKRIGLALSGGGYRVMMKYIYILIHLEVLLLQLAMLCMKEIMRDLRKSSARRYV